MEHDEYEDFSVSESENEEVKLTGRKAILANYGNQKVESSLVQEKPKSTKEATFKNKQRVMLLCSRGITHRYRHFLKDLEVLLPHARKDAKFDSKGNLNLLNELSDLNDCNNTLYLEVRKKQDLYLWLSKTPHGPSAKFHIQNVHTMDELKFTGNCMKGSRPFLSFDSAFDTVPHLQLLKQLFIHIFGTPKGHRKSKPFFDHIFQFTVLDGRIWFRNYQIVHEDKNETQLTEIGPRFVMQPMRIFEGSFGGKTLYENENFVHPNMIRKMQNMEKGSKYANRVEQKEQTQMHKKEAKLPETEMDQVDKIFQ